MKMVYDNKNMVYENKLTKCELFGKKLFTFLLEFHQ